MNRQQLADYHDLHGIITNETRQSLLVYLYQEPRSYSDLIEHTGLKPGSLYHHLKVMDELVHKLDHGLYSITPMGEHLLEDLQLVPESKPSVAQKPEEVPTPSLRSRDELINELIWLGPSSWLIIGLSLLVIGYLAYLGVSLAGVAIYAAPIPLVFDLIAILLGIFVLYLLERVLLNTPRYRRLPFAVAIRVISMLPAVIVGLALLLLYIAGLTVPVTVFPFLFAITVAIGYWVMSMGLQYLRGMSQKQSLNLALLPVGIDLLLGAVVLLVQM